MRHSVTTEIGERLEALVRSEGLTDSTPGFAALVAQGGTRLEYCVGGRDTDGHPITVRTSFRIASVTKQFTAAAVLRVMRQRNISLDNPLADFLPEVAATSKSITVRHLLTHTSGLPDYESHFLEPDGPPVTDDAVLEIVGAGVALKFQPGDEYSYSNTGYCLLSLLTARLSGATFGQYLQSNIFEPLGMCDTILGPSPSLDERAYGFSKANDGWQLSDQSRLSMSQGDGGIYSSVTDLVRWQTGLYNDHAVLPPDLVREMTSPFVQTNYANEMYGFGVAVTKINGCRVFLHHGVSIGFENALFYVPELDLSVALLSNIGGTDFNTIHLGKTLLGDAIGREKSATQGLM